MPRMDDQSSTPPLDTSPATASGVEFLPSSVWNKDKNWDRGEHAAMASATAALAVGGFAQNTTARAVGFGALAVKSLEKAARSYLHNDYLVSAINSAQAFGIGIWAWGVAIGSSAMQGAGPAVVATTGAAQMVHNAAKYKKGTGLSETDYRNLSSEFFEVAEMTMLSAGALTHNPYLRAAGFGFWSAGHLHEWYRKKESLHVMDAAGAALWSYGVARASSDYQGVGPALIGVAEVARFVETFNKKKESHPIIPMHHVASNTAASTHTSEFPAQQATVARAASQKIDAPVDVHNRTLGPRSATWPSTPTKAHVAVRSR